MLKKSFKLINNYSSKSLVILRSSKFSLIDEYLKRDKKSAEQAPKVDETLVSKKILEEAAKKKAQSQESSDIATRLSDKEHIEEKARAKEDKAISLQKELDLELDLPYKLYGTSAKAEKKVE